MPANAEAAKPTEACAPRDCFIVTDSSAVTATSHTNHELWEFLCTWGKKSDGISNLMFVCV